MSMPLYTNDRGLLVNMYDCTVCPKCGSTYRCVFNNEPDTVQCDDCGHKETYTPANGRREEE
jgi:ribosomal protein S27E